MATLVIISMQNDYYSTDTLLMIPKINNLRNKYKHVIFAVDWHPKSKHKCIADTSGAQIIDGLIVKDDDIIIKKGTIESYDTNSIFYDAKDINKQTRLLSIIEYYGITELHLCGHNINNIIKTSYQDAIKFELSCIILQDMCIY